MLAQNVRLKLDDEDSVLLTVAVKLTGNPSSTKLWAEVTLTTIMPDEELITLLPVGIGAESSALTEFKFPVKTTAKLAKRTVKSRPATAFLFKPIPD